MGSTSLVQRLGYPATTKLLIVNCDDLGSSPEANTAIFAALRSGAATSASLMVPCSATVDAAAQYRGEDVGVHLTLNCEWTDVRWGPLTESPSLCADDGGFLESPGATAARASAAEVIAECRAQITAAMELGFEPTHLDSHMHTLFRSGALTNAYVDLGVEYGLPLRLPTRAQARVVAGFRVPRRDSSARRRADRVGVPTPDRLVYTPVGSRERILSALQSLEPGVTEVLLHPAVDTPDFRSTHPDWEGRVDDHAFLTETGPLQELVERAGATLIGYRELRALWSSES